MWCSLLAYFEVVFRKEKLVAWRKNKRTAEEKRNREKGKKANKSNRKETKQRKEEKRKTGKKERRKEQKQREKGNRKRREKKKKNYFAIISLKSTSNFKLSFVPSFDTGFQSNKPISSSCFGTPSLTRITGPG